MNAGVPAAIGCDGVVVVKYSAAVATDAVLVGMLFD